jgi:hypothetical protein
MENSFYLPVYTEKQFIQLISESTTYLLHVAESFLRS